jgi:GTP-binding protein Era
VFKSGFIGIIGRPNVGKSTLLNRIIGEKIAITTHKPQTTRNKIMGIKNLEGTRKGQMAFLDTPGIHKASTPLNRLMVEEALDAFKSVDILLMLIDAKEGFHHEDAFIVKSLEGIKLPVFLIINKIDLIKKSKLLPLMNQFNNVFPFKEIIPVSALNGDGIEILTDEIWQLLPEGPPYFPEDIMTDRSERFIAAEIIREKITLLTHQEIPYKTAVIVDTFKEDEAKNLIRIQATITVEKDSQKGILIGKKGVMLKEIGTKARLDMEHFFAAKIFLELYVRVKKDWTHNKRLLREFGYTK